MYVLGTNLYTKEGEEIVKIGITTGSVDARISQLYTTGVPFRFRVIKKYETKNYYELEQALHRLLEPYRINRSREFQRRMPSLHRANRGGTPRNPGQIVTSEQRRVSPC
jgi:hypothetical protein